MQFLVESYYSEEPQNDCPSKDTITLPPIDTIQPPDTIYMPPIDTLPCPLHGCTEVCLIRVY